MQFFSEAVNVLQTLVIALGAGLAVWGVVNLLEGYWYFPHSFAVRIVLIGGQHF